MEDPEPLRTQNNKALAVVIGEASFPSMVRLRRPFIHRGHPWVKGRRSLVNHQKQSAFDGTIG